MKEKLRRKYITPFLLLWQGQLVSAFGDVAYEIALGFWVLAVTGSTALMGSLMAASAVPRVILSPFAGVWVDRLDRKWILVTADFIRGLAVVLVALTAYFGTIKIWMVFVAGIIIGIGAAFFNPAVSSIIPDIVIKDKLVRANSLISMTYTGSNIVGSTAGGFLYVILGAPLMFMVNGISYIFSSITEIFIKVPSVHHPGGKKRFFEDMKEGLIFTARVKGLGLLFVVAAFLNFFAHVAFILILPLFQRTESLGPAMYGIVMAALTAGMFAGMIFTAVYNIKEDKRFGYLIISLLLMSASWGFFPIKINVILMSVLIFTGGFFNSIINVLIYSIIQISVPQNMLGKVMGFLNTLSLSLTPIAMASGGVLGEFFSIKVIISLSFFIMGIVSFPLVFSKSLRHFITGSGL